jgi:C4-dicarboxylate transporter DctM subunit
MMMDIAICCILILVLMFVGVPVAYAFLWGSLFYLITTQQSLGAVVTTSFNAANSYAFLAIPLFILAGRLMVETTIAQRLVMLAEVLLRKVKGGMAAAIVLAAAFFGTITGSDIATANAVGSIMFPPMLRMGWDKRYIGAVLAVAAPLGFMIPPNTNAIMYATITNASVSDLFLSTIIPGIIWAALIMVINRITYAKWYHPELADEEAKQEIRDRELSGVTRLQEIRSSAYSAVPAIIMPVIILGGIYAGIFTSTEAGGVGCLYAIVVGLVLFRAIKLKNTWACFTDTAKDTGVILMISATSAVFNRILLFANVPALIADGMLGVTENPVFILLFIDIIFLIAGCFLSPPVIIFVVTPLLLPTARMVGVGDIQMGVMLFVAIGIGVITPPLAGNLFISARIARCSVSDILGPVLPYLFFAGIPVLLLVTYVPWFSTFLPNLVSS